MKGPRRAADSGRRAHGYYPRRLEKYPPGEDDRTAAQAEHAAELAKYGLIMQNARDSRHLLRDLYLASLELASPETDTARLADQADEYSRRLPSLCDGCVPDEDSMGNPNWISLTVRERDYDGPIKAEGVLPDGKEKAAPLGFLDKDKPDAKAKGRKPPAPRGFLFFRPSSSLVRILFFGAALGVIYTFLSARGWLPRLF
ncbi:MAG: hypothetical protein LBH65_03550 [Desulfovibrio sp.]|nr:hypothetical protein [Desulfovibrio sp.]